jgi:hypothetical protein
VKHHIAENQIGNRIEAIEKVADVHKDESPAVSEADGSLEDDLP